MSKFQSRKLLFAIFTSVTVVFSALIVPEMGLGEVITGLVSVAAIYIGGNAASRWISAKHSKKEPKEPKKEESAKKEPIEQGEPHGD